MSRNAHIRELEARIGYEFSNVELLRRALTHSSYGDGRTKVRSFERLEFLGDRVLGLLTAERLFDEKDEAEGELARRLNELVRKETCARVARRVDLGAALLMSISEERQGGRNKTSILGDACEALMAALYLDGGLAAASGFYQRFWAEELKSLNKSAVKDPKTQLQEVAVARTGEQPHYEILERTGPDHRPLFVIEVSVEGLGAARGTGKSKKDAERFAAQHLLEALGEL